MSTQKIKEYRQFYINGAWTDPVSDDSIDVLNPATEEVVARIGAGTAEDVSRAVMSAREAFNSFSQTSKQERLELLTEVRNLLCPSGLLEAHDGRSHVMYRWVCWKLMTGLARGREQLGIHNSHNKRCFSVAGGWACQGPKSW